MPHTTATAAAYLVRAFPLMGTTVRLVAAHGGDPAAAADAVQAAERELHRLAALLTRFDPGSALERLNDDPRAAVPVGADLAAAVAAGVDAHRRSDGLVDCGLGAQLVRAGYDRTIGELERLAPRAVARPSATAPGGAAPARPSREGAARIRVDLRRGVVHRPPGLRVDLGGLAKGLAADRAAGLLAHLPRATADLGGDLRATGTAASVAPQAVAILHPLDGRVVAVLEIADAAVATSAITARAWRSPDGTIAHHLLDPATGRPARTGLVQATALAPLATVAERLAKHALIAGPAGGRAVLRAHHGGVLVHESGAVERVAGEVPA